MLDAPEETLAPRTRRSPADARLRRDFVEDFAEPDTDAFLRTPDRVRVRKGLLPETKWGRIAAASAAAVILILLCTAAVMLQRFLLHDPRFTVAESSAIQIQGNSHVSRPQLLSIFGEDVERNIFHISLTDRRKQLESLPWVEHATVMRLLPDHVRVAIRERTPVAFVRQAGQIGLVDANGVLLDLPADSAQKYSFPVVTGIASTDPLSTRAARIKIYQRFVADLDSSGPHITENLSEVDLSNPEDIKALIPDHGNDVLVHFGDDAFLDRYQKYQQHLPEWRQQYPNLSSVDMRYDHQVVLEMAKNAPPAPALTPASTTPNTEPAPTAPMPAPAATTTKPAATTTRPTPTTGKPTAIKPQPIAPAPQQPQAITQKPTPPKPHATVVTKKITPPAKPNPHPQQQHARTVPPPSSNNTATVKEGTSIDAFHAPVVPTVKPVTLPTTPHSNVAQWVHPEKHVNTPDLGHPDAPPSIKPTAPGAKQ